MIRSALDEHVRHSLWLALALVGCATYEGSTSSFDTSSAGSSGVAGSSAGAPSTAGTGSASVAGGAGQQTIDEGGSAAGPETTDGGAGSGGVAAGAGSQGGTQAGRGGSAGSGGKAGSAGGAGGAGAGAGVGGTPGNAGTGGTAGSANAGSAGTAGSSGGTVHVLSQGKSSSADSEQTSKGNLAALGNDGSTTTRWCANDGAAGHNWQVDLGTSHSLSKLEIIWEKAAVYKFKVEGSNDGNTWSQFLDQTNSSNSASDQTYTLTTAPSARWVRITVTGLANSTTWASFFELSVSGY